MRNLTAGIIGAGGISRYHIAGYRAAGVSVRAIADPDTARAAEVAAAAGIPEVYESASRLIAQKPDLISICTPNRFHSEIAVAALSAGAHVLCEKPPARTAAETELMAQAAARSRRILMFDFNNRARPEAQALMQYIRAGEFGVLNSAQALWIRRCGIPGFGGWFTTRELSGGGPVIDLLHMLDLGLYFMGYPQPSWVLAATFSDFANDPSFKGPWGIPDVAGGVVDVETASHAFIVFSTGQALFTRASWAEMNEREEVSVTFQGTRAGGRIRRLFGTDGIDATASDTCELFTMEHGRPVNRKVIVPSDEKMGRERAVVNFVNAVRGTEEPLSTPDEAVRLMKIIDALYLSAHTHEPVRIS